MFDKLKPKASAADSQKPTETPLVASVVWREAKGPYESYRYQGRLAAKGATHVAFVESARVATPTMVARAAVARGNLGD